MKKLILTLAALVTFVGSQTRFAWGQKGHDVVAAIAEQNLTKKAR